MGTARSQRKETDMPPIPRLAFLALLSLLLSPALRAETEVIANSGQWQVLETETAGGEIRCDIRSKEIHSGQPGAGEAPYLYFIGNRDPDRGFDVRVTSGERGLNGADVRAATLRYDDQAPVKAWAYPIGSGTFGIAPSLREMRRGGIVSVGVPREPGEPARFDFSLIGFTSAYQRMATCNR
jgi:hypothetical protein